MHMLKNKCKCEWINMVRVIEYHFVSSHELSECAIKNNVGLGTKLPNSLQILFYFALSNPK
jgi:hypothetical protein